MLLLMVSKRHSRTREVGVLRLRPPPSENVASLFAWGRILPNKHIIVPDLPDRTDVRDQFRDFGAALTLR